MLPIFRDRDELAGGSDLGARIGDALAASRSLIVICSPYAAASKWVDQEVARFKTIGRSERIFPLIIAGEPFASENPDANLPECFPRSLRFTLDADGAVTTERSEPLAADAREGMDGWKNACLKLIAGILEVRFDELRQRERARQRRLQLVRVALAALAVLLVGASYVGLADADLAIPQGEEIRRTSITMACRCCDRCRPPPTSRVLPRARAPRSAARLLAYAGSGRPNGPAPRMPGRPDRFSPPWFAIARPPREDLKPILPLFEAAFRSPPREPRTRGIC